MEISDSTKLLMLRVVIFILYLAVGTWIFQYLERETQHKNWENSKYQREHILAKYNISSQDIKLLDQALRQPSSLLEWNYGNTFVFAITVITTIGYGHMVPKTIGGRVFCMVFALVGIPGTCLVLKSVGDKITEFLAALITKIEKTCLRRTQPRRVKTTTAITTFVLTMFVVLPLLALTVNSRRKEWSYFECFYFNFITLSTIGFGDFVPEFHRDFDYILVLLAFVGLSFVSSILCSLNVLIENYGIGARLYSKRMEQRSGCDKSGEELSDLSKIQEEYTNTYTEQREEDEGKESRTDMQPLTQDQQSSRAHCFRYNGTSSSSSTSKSGKRGSVQLSIITA